MSGRSRKRRIQRRQPLRTWTNLGEGYRRPLQEVKMLREWTWQFQRGYRSWIYQKKGGWGSRAAASMKKRLDTRCCPSLFMYVASPCRDNNRQLLSFSFVGTSVRVGRQTLTACEWARMLGILPLPLLPRQRFLQSTPLRRRWSH